MKRAFTLVALILLTAGFGFAQYPGQGNVGDEVTGVQVSESTPIFIPNAFTPNGDGVNDEYYIPDAGLSNFEFAVFDRWGNRVYHTFSTTFRWNGEANSRKVPSGTYVFLLNATNSKGSRIKRSGQISVVR